MKADVNQNSIDPLEKFYEVLEYAWHTISAAYEVSSEVPDMEMLFACVELHDANKAAEQVVINILNEVMEDVGRFTPWYKLPARSFGLTTIRDTASSRITWVLAPEAIQKWHKVLEPLAGEIQYKSGLIHAMLLVGDLTNRKQPDESCVMAECKCSPSRVIRLKQNILSEIEIICNVCNQPYLPLGG